MRHHHIRTIIFYIAHGIYYGAALGTLCGTLILPWLGTMYAAAWGLGIGLAMGILAGFMVAIINAVFYHTPYDLPLYRQRMTRLVGVVVAIGAGTLLVATTHGLLWGPYTDGFLPYFLPSLAGAVFWGGLSSAFATSLYADRYAISIHKQKNDIGSEIGIEGMLPLRRGIFQHYADRIVRPAWGLLAVVVGCVLLAHWSAHVTYGYYNSVDLIGVTIQGALAGTIGSFVLVCTAYFLTSFVARVFLSAHNMDYETLRQRLGAVQWIVTGFFALASLVFASQFLAGPLGLPMMTVIPAATLAGWWITHDFADWYLTPPEAKHA